MINFISGNLDFLEVFVFNYFIDIGANSGTLSLPFSKSNNLKIYGNPNLKLKKTFVVKNFKKDHRVFMMSCIAALTLGGTWKILDKDSINSSFPNFLNILKYIGAKIN